MDTCTEEEVSVAKQFLKDKQFAAGLIERLNRDHVITDKKKLRVELAIFAAQVFLFSKAYVSQQ